MSNSEQNTLKEILLKEYEDSIFGYAYDLTKDQLEVIAKGSQRAFKEWLQQKLDTLNSQSGYNAELLYDYVNGLVTELEIK